jgi:hypothetical protein
VVVEVVFRGFKLRHGAGQSVLAPDGRGELELAVMDATDEYYRVPRDGRVSADENNVNVPGEQDIGLAGPSDCPLVDSTRRFDGKTAI